MKQVSCHGESPAALWEAFLLQAKEDGERKSQLRGAALWEKKGEKGIPGLIDTSVPPGLGPERASRITNFSISREDDIHQRVVRKPLHKKAKKLRPKHTQRSVLLLTRPATPAGLLL